MSLLRTLSRARLCCHPGKGLSNHLTRKFSYPKGLLPASSALLEQQNRSSKKLAIYEEVQKSPVPALVLGLGGLIPFAAAPMFMFATGEYSELIHVLQVNYGACILSFLGGIRWGASLPEESLLPPTWSSLLHSVTPCLLAWLLLSMGPTYGGWGVMVGLSMTCLTDMRLWAYPAWFRGLRFVLTIGAILSIYTVLVSQQYMIEQKSKKESVDAKME